MIKAHLVLMEELKAYASPKAKLTRLLKSGQLVQVRRGLFVDSAAVSRPCLAPMIYGPSYLSFQYALSVYGLIPERAQSFTSASYHKNKNKVFHTPLGDFYYYYLPAGVYPYGILKKTEGDYSYLLASPEKALCDSVYKIKNIGTLDEMEKLLLEDWRMEKGNLLKLDRGFIKKIAPLYHRNSLKLLSEWLRKKERKHA